MSMRSAAVRQAHERSDRTGEICFVWKERAEELPLWYVRGHLERDPENADLICRVYPGDETESWVGLS